MNNDNVAAIRNAYAVAERKDLKGWISLFTPDGAFVDNSVGATYRGRTLADPVRNYGTAFSNMHRELYRIYVDGNVVVVQLALQGTHDGPLQLPFGMLPATGKQMDAPCCDVFELEDGKINRFDCYPEGSVILAQLGVLNNLDAALSHLRVPRQEKSHESHPLYSLRWPIDDQLAFRLEWPRQTRSNWAHHRNDPYRGSATAAIGPCS